MPSSPRQHTHTHTDRHPHACILTQEPAGVCLRVLQAVGRVREHVGDAGEEDEVEEADVVEELVLRDQVHQPMSVGFFYFI